MIEYRPTKEPENEPVVELEDISRIKYTARPQYKYGESGYMHLDFKDDHWESWERAYSSEAWYEAGSGIPDECRSTIVGYLEPVAKILGLELTEELVEHNNPRRLLDNHAVFMSEGYLKTGERDESIIVTPARLYILPSRQKVLLKREGYPVSPDRSSEFKDLQPFLSNF